MSRTTVRVPTLEAALYQLAAEEPEQFRRLVSLIRRQQPQREDRLLDWAIESAQGAVRTRLRALRRALPPVRTRHISTMPFPTPAALDTLAMTDAEQFAEQARDVFAGLACILDANPTLSSQELVGMGRKRMRELLESGDDFVADMLGYLLAAAEAVDPTMRQADRTLH